MRGFGGGGMQNLMKQAGQMQNKLKKIKEDFASKTFSGSAGGGAVEVRVTGEHMVEALTIKPEVIESGAEMIAEMVQLATNEAIKVAKQEYQKSMDQVTKGMSLPGMM